MKKNIATKITTENANEDALLSIYKRLITYVVPVLHWLIISIIGYAIFAAANAFYVEILKQIVDYISGKPFDSIVPKPDFMDTRSFIVVAVLIAVVVRGVGSIFGKFGISYVAYNIVFIMRNQLHDHYLNMLTTDFDKSNVGGLTSKVSFTVEQVATAVSDGLIVLVRESLTCVFLFAFMLYYSWQLTLLFILVIPLVALVFMVSARFFRTIQKKIQSGMETITHLISEVVTGHVVVKTFRAKSFEKKRFYKANKSFLSNNIFSALVDSVSSPVIQVLLASINAVVIWVALDETFISKMSPGSFIAFFVVAGLLAAPIKKLSNINNAIQKGLVAAQDIFKLLDKKVEKDDAGKISLWNPTGQIEFNNMSFSYNKNSNPALKDISFNIEAGKTVAVVGKSGSGKSTLIKLLMRLYDHDKGSILIDGMPLNHITLSSLRKHISLVSQANVLFNNTVLYNVSYGDVIDADTETKVINALKQANAFDFVALLPQGIHAEIGEKGSTLSGGQAQRIAIARALYKQAPILILDEATSALDSESEKAIQDALDKTKDCNTRFIITHRMATAQKADTLIVIDKGILVQQGSDKDLRQQSGVYRDLLNGQFLLNDKDLAKKHKTKLKNAVTIPAISGYKNKKKLVHTRNLWRSFKKDLTFFLTKN